jgi:hypothetical protein
MRQTNSSAALSTLVYRSRAVSPLSGQDLQGLMQAAQARNRREAITGVMLYDDSRFFQWLEGPAEGIARVMRSIRRDPRHTDLEVLDDSPASRRRFADWDMRLATRGIGRALCRGDVIEPSPEIIDGLRRHPRRAAGFLLRLAGAPASFAPSFALPDPSSPRAPMTRTTASVLRTTFLDVVVPKLLYRHGAVDARYAPTRPSPRAGELAELLVSNDETASLQLIRELRGDSEVLDELYAPLFEPAARKLGDLWTDDICSELDVTLGLARLQTAVRLLGIDAPRPHHRGVQRSVLVVPAPGEAHQLAASLDSEWLWSKGWAPQYGLPPDDRALEDLVAGEWIDVLDLSLSAAFRRKDRLTDLRVTITQARRASRNTALLVVVGGRVFAESRARDVEVGADLASPTSESLDVRLLAGLTKHASLQAGARRRTGQDDCHDMLAALS